MSVFGDNQENLMCLFKKIQQRQNQRISDLETQIAELQKKQSSNESVKQQKQSTSSSRHNDVSHREMCCLPQDGAEITADRLRPKKIDKDPEYIVNGSNIRGSNGRPLQECKKYEQMKPHRVRGYCNACYTQVMRKEKLCVKCKKADKLEGKKVCSKCRDKYDNTKSSRCKKCKERVKTRASGLCEKCYRAELRSRPTLCKSCKEERKNYSSGMCRSCFYKQKEQENQQFDQNNIKMENLDEENGAKTHPILQPKSEFIEVSMSSYALPSQIINQAASSSKSNQTPSTPLKQAPITKFLSPNGGKRQSQPIYEVITLNSDDDN
ncbi:hypothetical protein M3Y97_01083800 [Aphelenchoides bicaudatus]|nr:hypothetical protein M3Y97_01083800 [Aphelenchoides bicaudatus]